MDRFDVKIIELHGRRHAVVEFNALRHIEEVYRLSRLVCTYGPQDAPRRPSHWVQLGAKVRKNKGPWHWVGPNTAQRMGVEHFSFMTFENEDSLKVKA